MTVSSELRKAGPYACDGSDVTFDFAFKVFAKADLRVVLTDSDGVEADLTLDAVSSGFSVSLNADQDNNPGGTITTTEAHASGNTITITSDIADTQGVELPAGGGWSPSVVERALDRLTILVQQVRLLVAGALRQPVSDSTTIAELPTADARAGKYLVFDDNGDPTVSESVVPTEATVSAFMETVLDDTTAAAARTTLGLTIGTDVQAQDADLAALAALSSTGLVARTGAGTAAARTLTAGGKISISNGDGVSANPTITGALPRSYLAGCALSNNGSDATNDIDIAAGECRDSTNTVNITVAALTKQLDANWAAGTNQGMRYSGAAIANTTYHVWAVSKADGTQDVYATPNGSAATASAALTLLQAETGGSAYLYARRIGSILRESAAIVAFTQDGDYFVRSTAVVDVNTTNPGTSAVLSTLSVPLGVNLFALINGYLSGSGGGACVVNITDPAATDAAPSESAAPLGNLSSEAVDYPANVGLQVRTNTSGQIRYRASFSDAGIIVRIATLGWIDRRGRDA